MWFMKPKGLLPAEECNPGRSSPNRETPSIDKLHFVHKTRLHAPWPEGMELAMFGFGCFWCSENVLLNKPGVHSTQVGYAGGVTLNPTYRDVCGGDTNHNEVVRVVFDPNVLPFSELLRAFWQAHDPLTPNQQGNDRGTQYRSGIYYYSEAQKADAEASKFAYECALRLSYSKGAKISTEIVPAPHFYMAEDAHQQYDAKPGSREYCGLSPLGVKCPPASDWAKPANAM
ncbi:putative peptide methionine sulfoxide reductase msrA [Pelagophyceae sp. CCMP2097]|nr:putative peptide methionine sulfoxide reductase msrA [Pelagophyceae sp. CCMP2097]|mmetsp:Transcript_15530/g.52366  ORF Transcript_15530/g.52366 Transcript_15530/m.52366 type:complete len:229 (+) Transcript_15530:101-787(+)